METNPNEVLMKVFPDVLEKMTFMFAEPANGTLSLTPGREYVEASMCFSGPISGSLHLVAPVSLCVAMAENMFPTSETPTNEKAVDVLKEVLNVTCGNVLTELAGSDPVFELTVPQVSRITDDTLNIIAEVSDSVFFQVEDFPAILRLRIFS